MGGGIRTPAQLQPHLTQARICREKACGESGGKGAGKGGKGHGWPGEGKGSAGSTSTHAEPRSLYKPAPAEVLSAAEGRPPPVTRLAACGPAIAPPTRGQAVKARGPAALASRGAPCA